MINIGKLRHRIELQNYTTEADDAGHPVKTYSTHSTVWAWVRPLSGRERENAGQIIGEVTHKITIRYNDTVAVTDRVKFGSRYFDINTIADFDEKNEFMEITAKEIV